MRDDIRKLPFNDFKHPPTRPEIDLLLGVLPAIELKRFEHQLELLEPRINWAMHWYSADQGWGYRGSYLSRVACILHFYRGYFTMTLSIPLDRVDEFRQTKDLTSTFRNAFSYGKPSMKTLWVSFLLREPADTAAAIHLIELKLRDLKASRS
jgi:hypothetical protein